MYQLRQHPEPHRIGVEQFLEMLRFDQRKKLKNCPESESGVGMILELENTTNLEIGDESEMPGISSSFMVAVKNSAKSGFRSGKGNLPIRSQAKIYLPCLRGSIVSILSIVSRLLATVN